MIPRKRPRILLLDDDPAIARFVSAALPPDQYRVIWAEDVQTAYHRSREITPDVALVDIRLRDTSGWEFVQLIRKTPRLATLPVVMLTASCENADREKFLSVRGDRYLLKPVTAESLKRVVGEILAVRNAEGWVQYQRSASPPLRQLLFDPLTEIPTLPLVVEQISEKIRRGDSFRVYCVAIEPLFRQGERHLIDSFDTLRREFVRGLHVVFAAVVGNEGAIAISHPRANDFYCFSGHSDQTSPTVVAEELERHARGLLQQIDADPFLLQQVAIFVGSSVIGPDRERPVEAIYDAVREADAVAGRREGRYFQHLRESLIDALKGDSIRTHFQPVLDLETRTIVGYEALSRGPAQSEIERPEVLFELARDSQLEWHLQALCIRNMQPFLSDVCRRGLLFFNLESHFIQQLSERGLKVFEGFARDQCVEKIVIEVTERSAISDYRVFRGILHELKAMGFRIALDDCGSGYATLEAVAELQPDFLKVGHGLFREVEKNPVRRHLVELVHNCARSIGAITIAEAIETEEQLDLCREIGIKLGQGYLFARPAPWDEVKDLV